MAITDKIYVKNHRQLSSQLDTHIPKGAFKGATLDVLFQGDGLEQLDETTPATAITTRTAGIQKKSSSSTCLLSVHRGLARMRLST